MVHRYEGIDWRNLTTMELQEEAQRAVEDGRDVEAYRVHVRPLVTLEAARIEGRTGLAWCGVVVGWIDSYLTIERDLIAFGALLDRAPDLDEF